MIYRTAGKPADEKKTAPRVVFIDETTRAVKVDQNGIVFWSVETLVADRMGVKGWRETTVVLCDPRDPFHPDSRALQKLIARVFEKYAIGGPP